MDPNRWTVHHLNPPPRSHPSLQNPNLPSPVDLYHPPPVTYYPPHLQSPNPTPHAISSFASHDYYTTIPSNPTVGSAGADFVSSASSYPHNYLSTDAHVGVRFAYQPSDRGLAVYYSNGDAQSCAAQEATPHYVTEAVSYPGAQGFTIHSNVKEQLPVANPNTVVWTNPTVPPSGNNQPWMRRQKKAKIVQSAYCDVCRVDCNSKDILEQHKLGKKHKKSLEKANKGSSIPAASAPTPVNPIIGPQENPNKTIGVTKSKKKKSAAMEDLLTKKRKVVQGGAAVNAVKACAMCNVVCNSETVFRYHLMGHKHIAMAKKSAATGAGVAI